MKVQIIFYSLYGHVYRMAEAVADGVREVGGAEVGLYQVPELIPQEVLERMGADKARAAFAHIPIATVDQLPEADALIFGTPTRFGNMCAQMRNFLDQTGGIWAKGALIGKVGSVFTSTGTQHGGAGDHHYQFSHHPAPSRDDTGRSSLFRTASNDHHRDKRGFPLWGHHHCRTGRVPAAQ